MRTIKSQMLFSLLIAILFIFLTVAFFISQRLSSIPVFIKEQNQELVAARADEISKEIQGAREQVRMISQSNILKSGDLDAIKAFLPTVVLEGRFRNMTYSDIHGQAWTTYDADIDISNQEQFIKIIEEGHDYWVSQPFYSPFIIEDIPIITVSYAIKDEGITVGLVNAVISTAFLDTIFREINYLGTGYAYIVNHDGEIVIHPSEEIGINTPVSSWIQDSQKEAVLYTEPFGSIDYVHPNNTREIAFFEVIESQPDWIFVLTIPHTEVYKEYNAIMEFLQIVFLITMVVIIVFAVIYSQTLSHPVTELIKTFERAAKGDLNAKANEHINNEIGLAGQRFNSMIRQIKELTYRDTITGLYNLNSFMLELPGKIRDAQSTKNYEYIVIISIDDFKRINSLAGYESGNDALRQVANKLLDFIREDEMVGRYFGDELIVYLRDNSLLEVEKRIHALRTCFDRLVLLNNIEVFLKVSLGIAFLDDKATHLDQVIHYATIAKLNVKKRGGNSFEYYSKEIDDLLVEEQAIEEELNNALAKNEFILHFQPIVKAYNNEIVGYEALLRWNHPRSHKITVSRLIEVAERRGLIFDIGAWVLKKASNTIKDINARVSKAYFVSVNVSAVQLEDLRFTSLLTSVIQETQIDPKLLHLEITETQMMLDVESKIKLLNGMKHIGVKISIDDFGTGYSSLAYLSQLPVDILKIDQKFIAEMFVSNRSMAVIETVISLARVMNLQITAEGVETEEARNRLIELGCEFYQGYLFSRPKPFT